MRDNMSFSMLQKEKVSVRNEMMDTIYYIYCRRSQILTSCSTSWLVRLRNKIKLPHFLVLQEACEEIVTDLGHKINSRVQEVREDMALSVLILAEVQVHMPPVPDAAALCRCSPQLLLLLAALASLHHTLLAS